jgi:hypothetical protein
MSDFDNELSDLSIQKYNTESNLMSTILGVPVAAAVDTGVTIWNSLVPERYETETAGILGGINENLANIYSENEDTVKALSFVGGLLLPQGIALKGMNLLRSGAKGATWFSKAGEIERLANIKTAYEGAGTATNAFKEFSRMNRFAQAGNALVDATVLEGVLFATMNAHPFMEDYVKDPFKNAGIGILFGTGIMGAGNMIAGRYAVKGVKQEVEQASNEVLLQGFERADITANASDKLIRFSNNMKNWENMLQEDLTEHTKALIRFNIADSHAKQFSLLEETLSPNALERIGKTGDRAQEHKQLMIDRINAEPERWAEVNSISFSRVGEDAVPADAPWNPMFANTTLPGGITPLTKETKKGPKAATVLYSPKFDAFMTPKDIKYYGTAVDLGYLSADDLVKGMSKNWHVIPDLEISMIHSLTSSPVVDAAYLKGLAYFDRLEVEELYKPLKIGAADYPKIQGILSRIQKEMSAPGSTFDINKVQIHLIKDEAELLKPPGTPIPVASAFQYLQDSKILGVRTEIAQGVPPQVISIRYNMPHDTVRAIANGEPDHLLISKPFSEYTDAAQIEKILDLQNHTLSIRTNANKIPHAQMRARLMTTMQQNMDDQIKSALFANTKSTFMQTWNQYFNSKDFEYLRDIVRERLAMTGNAFMGAKFFTSADHALRDMKEISAIATNMGKQISEIHLRAVADLFAPIKSELSLVAKDPAALTEHNIALAVNARIKGYREYRDGKFFYQDPDVPMITQLDPISGKPVQVKNMVQAQFQGNDFEITTEAVKKVFDWYSVTGREMFNQANTLRQIPGVGRFSDTGFWVPSFNPRDKFIAYVLDKGSHQTTLLHGKTSADLQSAIEAFSTKNGVVIGQTHDIIRHGTDQEMYNIIAGRHDPMFMTNADVTQIHSGSSAPARVSTSPEQLVDIVHAYENQLNFNIKAMAELQMSDVFDFLGTASKYTQSEVKGQPVNKLLNQPKDAAAVLRNTFIGKNNLDQALWWKGTNEIYTTLLEKTLGMAYNVIEPVLNVVKGQVGKGRTLSDLEYTKLQDELARRGIPDVFAGFREAEARNLFHTDRTVKAEALAPRMMVLTNMLAATTLLRVGELGQAYVNAISLPILMTSEISSKLPARFMNTALSGSPELGAVKTMYEGWRFAHTKEAAPFVKYARDNKWLEGVVSEVDELFRQARQLDPGMLSAVEGAMKGRIVETLSKASNFSEQFVREKAFSTGVYIAKTSYPGLPDAGVLTFARDFMDRTIGNYAASQRPTAFQGTFGIAMGLFQTYMVTLAQSLFRHLEKGEFKALAKTMLAQGGIFGAKSLPGFNIVSEQIGEHFSDQNMDLITGTFRALPTKLAETIIYGLPSSFSQAAITSRGDIQPRIPDPFSGISAVPAINLTMQTGEALGKVASSLFSVDKTAGQGLMEALSMQSISRPVARISELLSGESITNKGNLIAGPDEIWTPLSVMARAFSTRPTSEARARDAIHLNTVYGSIDRENRQEIAMQLRTHLRGGSLNENVVASLAEKYLRTGSPAGWNSVVNSALGQTVVPAGNTVRNYLAPDSPTMRMVNDLY